MSQEFRNITAAQELLPMKQYTLITVQSSITVLLFVILMSCKESTISISQEEAKSSTSGKILIDESGKKYFIKEFSKQFYGADPVIRPVN